MAGFRSIDFHNMAAHICDLRDNGMYQQNKVLLYTCQNRVCVGGGGGGWRENGPQKEEGLLKKRYLQVSERLPLTSLTCETH